MATIFGALPYILQNGTVADATQVMSDLNKIIADGNANAAENGVNSSITALLGLTQPIPIAGGSSTHFIGATSGGAAAAQTIATTTPTNWSLTTGFEISFLPGFSSVAGGTTLSVNGGTALAVRKPTPSGPAALGANDWVAGQMATVVYDGTAFLTQSEVAYPALFAQRASLASASITDLGTIGAHNVLITGTTTITGFGSSAVVSSPIYLIQFSASLTLVSSASLILPGGYNIQTANSDFAIMQYLGSGNWQMLEYTPALRLPTVMPPSGSFKNLIMQVNTDTTLSFTADELTLVDSSGRTFRVQNVSLNNTITNSGANGLDTGSLSVQNFYFVWAIYNPSTFTMASIVSLSPSIPTFPAGYTFAMRVGAIFYATTGRLWRTIQRGRSVDLIQGTFPVGLPLIAQGPAGTYSGTSPTLISASLAAFVPSTAAKVFVHGTNTYKGLTNCNMQVAPSVSWGGTNNGPSGSNGSAYPIWQTQGFALGTRADIVLEALSIGFASDNSGGAALLAGWEDNI